MLRRSLIVFALAVALPVGLGACGDDDEATTTATTPTTAATTPTAGAGETVDVSLTDFAIDPKNPSVKAGEVTFNVTNDGTSLHNLEIEGPDGPEELKEDIPGGDSGTLTVDLSKPGKYKWICPVGDHEQRGMKGGVTVK